MVIFTYLHLQCLSTLGGHHKLLSSPGPWQVGILCCINKLPNMPRPLVSDGMELVNLFPLLWVPGQHFCLFNHLRSQFGDLGGLFMENPEKEGEEKKEEEREEKKVGGE